jgi:hypothetical protein|tara:strand:+ start:770 stop:1288 length:519 start_codon:yes stop_codon:yes gene_type:complete
MNVKSNDKIFIRHGEYNIPFIGLEEALKEYNEENINTIVSNVLDLLEKEKMSREEYYKIWTSQHDLLKQDYGFVSNDGGIIFELSLANFHRNNEELMEMLKKYVNYIITKRKENDDEFAKPKQKKDKIFKDLEGKTGIKEENVDQSIDLERNIDNLLVIIANNRQKNSIKFK